MCTLYMCQQVGWLNHDWLNHGWLKTNLVICGGESGGEQVEGGGSKGGETERLVSPRCRPLLPGLVRIDSHSTFSFHHLFLFQEVQRHPLSVCRTCLPCFPPYPSFVQIHTVHPGEWTNQQKLLRSNCQHCSESHSIPPFHSDAEES